MITTIVKFLLIICMVLTPVGAYLIIDTLTTYEQKKKIKKINIVGMVLFLLLAIIETALIINNSFSIEYLGELKEITNYAIILLLLIIVLYLIVLVIIEKIKKVNISKKEPKKINILLALILSFFVIFVSYGMIRNLIETREHDDFEHLDKTIQILANNEGDSE